MKNIVVKNAVRTTHKRYFRLFPAGPEALLQVLRAVQRGRARSREFNTEPERMLSETFYDNFYEDPSECYEVMDRMELYFSLKKKEIEKAFAVSKISKGNPKEKMNAAIHSFLKK